MADKKKVTNYVNNMDHSDTRSTHLDFGGLVKKAQGGDVLAAGQLKQIDYSKLDFQNDFNGFDDKTLQWLNKFSKDNGISQLGGIVTAKQEENATNKIMKEGTPKDLWEVKPKDSFAAASTKMRTEVADEAAKADAKMNGTAPGSGNRATAAAGNLTEDRPLTTTEKRNVYGAGLTEEQSRDADRAIQADEDAKYGKTTYTPAPKEKPLEKIGTGTGGTGGTGAGMGTASTPTDATAEGSPETDSAVKENLTTGNADGGNGEYVPSGDRKKQDSWWKRMVYGNNIGSVEEREISDKRVADALSKKEKAQKALDLATESGDKEAIERATKAYNDADENWKELSNRQNAAYESARAKDSKEEKQALMSEFLKNNPNMAKAIFSSKSGYNMGQRLAMLGEILANAAYNGGKALSSAAAGREFQYETTGTADMFRDATKKEMERNQQQLDTEKQAELEQADRVSRIKQNPYLKGLSTTAISEIAASQADGTVLSKADAVSRWFKELPPEEQDKAYEAYVTSTKSYAGGLETKGKNLDLQAKELDNVQKAITGNLQTTQQANEVIRGINETIQNLQDKKIKSYDLSQDKYWEYINGYLGYRKGVKTVGSNSSSSSGGSESSSKSDSENVSGQMAGNAGVSAIAKLGGNIGGGAQWAHSSDTNKTFSSATGSQANVDELVLQGIPTAEASAANWTAERKKYIDSYNAAIDREIEYWQNMLSETEAQMQALKSRSAETVGAVNDGIIKAPHMKQWLMREDGTKIRLNPDDSVYATVKTITAEKDNGKEDIIKMLPEDRVVIVQKKLGHEPGKKICKDIAKYLEKLGKE